MMYIVETSLRDFNFWSGAISIAANINNLDNADECWELLENWIDGDPIEPMTETEINDFVWFYAWDILIENELVDEE